MTVSQTFEGRRRRSDVRTEVIARRLGGFAALSPAEVALLKDVGEGPVTTWERRSFLTHAEGRVAAPRYILTGWAAHVRELADGRRQLIRLLLPGDAAALFPRGSPQPAILCLTTVQTLDGEAIMAAARDPAHHPGITVAVAMAEAQERRQLMDQVVRLGRETAFERTASLFVELYQRCAAIDAAHGGDIDLPLTQEMLGDLLGLSVVHVNRTVQQMRRDGLIRMASGRLQLLDIEDLVKVSGGSSFASQLPC